MSSKLEQIISGLIAEHGGEAQANRAFTFPHGEGGLLAFPGAMPEMDSTIPRASDFAAMLPLLPSVVQDQIFEVVTNQTAPSGTNPADACGSPPVPGNLAKAQITVPYGELYMGTQQINVTKAALRNTYADLNRQLQNSAVMNSPYLPEPVALNPSAINTPIGKAFMELAYDISLANSHVVHQGDPSLAAADSRLGFIKEYRGIDSWITTGYTDAVGGQNVPALDSKVDSYNKTLAGDIVDAVCDIVRAIRVEAEESGLGAVSHVALIHPYLRYPLIDLWACNYHTARCSPSDTNGRRLDLGRVTELRDQMLRGNYLLIDGVPLPIVTSYGHAATQAEDTGVWTSDIMLVPMTNLSRGGEPISYMEYVPYNVTDVATAIAQGMNEVRVLNGGLYMTAVDRAGFCLKYLFHAQLRFVMKTPWAAGRVDDVQWTVNQKFNHPGAGHTYNRGGGLITSGA